MPTFKAITLGCKVNRSETDTISSRMKAAGWTEASPRETADVCIVNSCAVTGKASQQSRQAIRHAIRCNPGARIIVTGCYATLEPKTLGNIPGIHSIVDHQGKMDIPNAILGLKIQEVDTVSDAGSRSMVDPNKPAGNRTRPFLKVQDGCNAFCTYCIVPYARGPSRSVPVQSVLEQIETFRQVGHREVVLSGIHLGLYGRDLNPEPIGLIDLLRRIDTACTIDRVRLSSIEPLELTDDIIYLTAVSRRFCPHFHIPLQSGDDTILKRMHRPYTRTQFRERILQIHRHLPDAAIGVDIMIGFPGETDTAFQNTYRLIEELPASYLHVFPFSPRNGTAACRYSDKVPARLIQARSRKMRQLGIKKKRAFYHTFLGREMKILVEEKRDPGTGRLKGLTANYLTVTADGPDCLKNRFITVMLDTLQDDDSIFGTVRGSNGR